MTVVTIEPQSPFDRDTLLYLDLLSC